METVYKLSGNRVLKVEYSDCNESPRDWDNLSKMIFFGKHSHLGDTHNFDADDYSGWNELEKEIKKEYNCAIIQPIYAYSHGNFRISTSPFGCRWDSGQLGFAIITKEAIRENWSIKNVTKKYREHSEKILNCEVEILDQYVSGETYSFFIENEDEDIEDSCTGFYGSDIKTNGILEHLSEEDRGEVLKQIG